MGNGTSSTALRDHFSRLFATGEEENQEDWKQLFSLPGSVQDVFEAVFSTDIEKLLVSHIDYIALFLRKAVDTLRNPLNAEIDVSEQALEKLNSLRYITRIMPVVLQRQGDSSVQEMLWSPDNHLALDLVSALLNSAFAAGFTCVQNDYEETQRLGGDAELIWYPGLIVPKVSSMGYALDDNRIEVVRCILTCCCEDIYATGETAAGHRNLWVWLFTCKEMPHTSALCFSLINAVVTFNPDSGFMPILNYSNVSQEMAMTSAQLLTVFLHTEVPTAEEIQASTELQQILSFLRPTIHAESESGNPLPTQGTNICVEAIKTLREESDFRVLFESINRLLSLKKELGMEEEALMLTWELCSLNPALVHYIAGQSEVKILYKSLLYLMWASLDDQALTGLMQLTTFILLLLSSGKIYL